MGDELSDLRVLIQDEGRAVPSTSLSRPGLLVVPKGVIRCFFRTIRFRSWRDDAPSCDLFFGSQDVKNRQDDGARYVAGPKSSLPFYFVGLFFFAATYYFPPFVPFLSPTQKGRFVGRGTNSGGCHC